MDSSLRPVVLDPSISEESVNQVETYLCLPYRGIEGERIITKFRKSIAKFIPATLTPRFTYKGKKLGTIFRIKDKVPEIHMSNLIYGYKYNSEHDSTFLPDYIGETNVRYRTRTYQHEKTDKKSSIYKESVKEALEIKHGDFRIIDSGYVKYFDRRIAEALYVKEFKPKLNAQKISYKLKLFP